MREIAARLCDAGIERADFDARKLAEHFSGDEKRRKLWLEILKNNTEKVNDILVAKYNRSNNVLRPTEVWLRLTAEYPELKSELINPKNYLARGCRRLFRGLASVFSRKSK